jgi:TetR/AcrR family transcriptional regulator
VRAKVLEAGERLFAERGFAGVSFRELAQESGVSMGLIQYHFGTKERLYEAVKERAMASYMRAQAPQFALPGGDFARFVEGGLREYFRFFESNPAWMKLAAWATLEGDTKAWPGEHELMDQLVARVREGQRGGAVGAVDPELLLIAVGGLMRGWVMYRDRYASRLAHLGGPEQQEDAYLKLCAAMVEGLHRGGDA